MEKLKSKEQKDTKEVSANQERINTKLTKRKKELTEKINSKRFPDMQLLSKIGGEALQILQIQITISF